MLRFDKTLHEAGGERYVYHLPSCLRLGDFTNFYLGRYVRIGKKSISIGTGGARRSVNNGDEADCARPHALDDAILRLT